MPKISISYRRADSEAMTGRIFDRLSAHYGKEAIFRDIDDIPPGTDFRQHINEMLLKTTILLAIVGPEWLGMGSEGLERINEESDPVRVEVETALRRRVPIIPVLIGNTKMPSSNQLPPSLKDFAFRNAVKVDTGQDFDYHMDRLIRSMDTILGQAAAKPTAPSSPPSRETKIPTSTSAKPSAGAATPAAASASDPARKQDTGSRPVVAFKALMANRQRDAGGPAPSPASSPAWLETLWPASQQGRIVRLVIVAAIAVPLVLLASGGLPGGAGGHGQRLLTLTGHSGPVSSVAFSPNARTIASGSADKSIKIWDADNGQLLRTLTGGSDSISSVAFLPNGKRIVSGSWDRSIVIWDAETGQSLRALKFDQTYSWEVPPAVWSITVSPDGTRVASGSADSTVKIWNDATGELLRILKGHSDIVESVAFSPDGRLIVSGSKDATVRIWNAETGQLLRNLTDHAGQILAVAISPDGRRIAAGGSGNAVTVWSLTTGQLLRTILASSSLVESVTFSPDGKRIAAGSKDGLIEIWDAETGQFVKTLTGHSAGVRAVAFSPDGRHLVSGSDDKTVDVWSAN